MQTTLPPSWTDDRLETSCSTAVPGTRFGYDVIHYHKHHGTSCKGQGIGEQRLCQLAGKREREREKEKKGGAMEGET